MLNVIAPKTFIFSIIIYLSTRLYFYYYHGNKYDVLRFYLGDFLALPIFVPVSVTIQSFLGQRRNQAKPCLIEILIYWIVISFFFEVIFPQLWSHTTSDIVDVIVYFIGGVCLWLIEGKKVWNRDCFPR